MHRRTKTTGQRIAWLGVPFLASVPFAASAQLEEVIVTAQRRETSLQDTPISIQAFTSQDLEVGGIDQGRDLGIMVPNVVLNPAVGGNQTAFFIRGLPGVGVYIDGVWQGGTGFQQLNFAEIERVEILRGPQGTLFGRNTNGGAVNITTRMPGDEFAARLKLDVGEFNRRDMTLAVDVPLSDTLKTKFMASSYQNDGFLQGLSVPRSFGDQDDTLVRADVLWEPTDNFSLRFTANDEDKSSTDARIVQFTNTDHPRYLSYNIICGNPDFMAAARAVDANWPDPPASSCRSNSFTPQTHEPGFPGGEVGKWETKSDTMESGLRADLSYYTLTMNWDITDKISLESITSLWEMNSRQVIDFDGSEFIVTTDDYRDHGENTNQEFHLTGSHWNDRINWLAGFYYLDQKTTRRFYRWGMWEFTNPNVGPNDPSQNAALIQYVRDYGALLGIPGLAPNPGATPAFAGFSPLTVITDDRLTQDIDEEEAFFGEATISVTDKLDLTFGMRIATDKGAEDAYVEEIQFDETSAFRTTSPFIEPVGDNFAGTVISQVADQDFGNITTNKFGLNYHLRDDMMAYLSYSEGFSSGGEQFVANVGIVTLQPEVVSTTEIGLKSTLANGSLRFNAAYFDSEWEGMRVQNLPPDPNNPGQRLPFPYPSSDGRGEASGFEFDLTWLATDQLRIAAGIGLIDTKYIERGLFDGLNGIAPNSPFAYAPDESASLSMQYDIPLSNGGNVLVAGQYGWMGEYVRDSANQRTPVDANGNHIFEPSYGIFNASLNYEPANADWGISLWGRNLTDEWYVNGGFDTRTVWGYDFTVIGRSREVGVGFTFNFN
jgi:iron complex outermembrane receptor protein